MNPHQSKMAFDEARAAEYDRRFEKLAVTREALHLIMQALLADLPTDARVLCVGAGTGAELVFLAREFPGWQFVAVEPSVAMLNVCRRKCEAAGIAARCEFHEGYLGSLAPTEPFDVATSILVTQFVLDREARTELFRSIADRLKPGAMLVSADFASDIGSEQYQRLFGVWAKMLKLAEVTDEAIENMRTAYGKDVSVTPAAEIEAMIARAGFDSPVLFYQAGLIHAWCAQKRRTGS